MVVPVNPQNDYKDQRPIEPPQFNSRDYSLILFIEFLRDYFTAEEMITAGEDSRLRELLEPAFRYYHEQNIGNAQEAVNEAGKRFVDDSNYGIIRASNLFLSYFAQRHLKEQFDPGYLYDSDFAKIQPNGLYIRSGAYVLLTNDYLFLLTKFAEEERRLMFEFMDLYKEGFSKDLIKSLDRSRRSRKRI